MPQICLHGSEKMNEDATLSPLDRIKPIDEGLRPKRVRKRLREALLLRTRVVGTEFEHNAEKLIRSMKEGDHPILIRESDNPYDENAIAVTRRGRKIGYVPRQHNTILANLMDQEVILVCKVEKISGSDLYVSIWTKVPETRELLLTVVTDSGIEES